MHVTFSDPVVVCSARKKVCSKQQHTRKYELCVPASSDTIPTISVLKSPMHQNIRNISLINFIFFTAVTIKIAVLGNVRTCSLLDLNRRLTGICCLHHRGWLDMRRQQSSVFCLLFYRSNCGMYSYFETLHFWHLNATSYCLVEKDRRFGEMCCIHLLDTVEENADNTFLRIAGTFLPKYMAPHSRKQ
jgi:hypothetical protein